MFVYRFAREPYINDLTGDGAKIYGGRWNQKGTAVLYTSEHCSLALLELLVHASPNLLPRNIHLLKLFIPSGLSFDTVDERDLPENWRHYPAPQTLADIGSEWVAAKSSAGLKVPSVLVPGEHNILLNPNHSAFGQVKIESTSPFNLDSRFYSD